MNFDYNVLIGIGIAGCAILFIWFGSPYLKKFTTKYGQEDIYKKIELSLLILGYSIREAKLKEIINKVMIIINECEKLDLAPQDKKAEAVDRTVKVLINEFSLDLSPEAISVIINIAVSFLPPTNEVIV